MTENEDVRSALDSSDELLKLLVAVNKDRPKKEDRDALVAYLKQNPEAWRRVGNVARSTANHIITRMPGGAAVQESVRVGYLELQKELQQETDTALEHLHIEGLVLCWLEWQYTERVYVLFLTSDSADIGTVEYWDRRVQSAHKRYLRASETLSRIRKMNLTVVQVNIGQQQVNRVG